MLYTVIAVSILYKLAPKLGLFRKLINKKTMGTEEGYVAVDVNAYDNLLGVQGVTLSICRPSGKAKFGSERYDVVSEGDFIEKGIVVK